ncbi:MAG: XdhC family protein [Euryarchaeota archaeon]|nr:XdhC family protein [Euryarchaeota archaeon]MDE2046723.1 XdhC family protein [Thermoplasmata archaeon]
MDRRVLKEALALSDAHFPYVLATIVDAHGSVPAKKGAAMLVREDGRIVGTIGGAGLEEKVRFLARQALRHHEGGLHRFDLKAWKPGGLQSLCGGSVDVAVEYVAPKPNVLLWGGGHVALALSRQLALLDYDHSVADDRGEYVSAERFPNARHRWVVAPQELPSTLEKSGERFSHAYLLGYDAKKDEEVAFRLLPTFSGAVGLIASRSKREITLRSLKARGLDPETLSRLRSPIGVPMGAETPEEIAVSIAGEIIQDLRSSVRKEEVAARAEEAATDHAQESPGQA